MNLKIGALIILVILSFVLCLFTSYAEMQDGMKTLINNAPTPSNLLETIKTIDKIV